MKYIKTEVIIPIYKVNYPKFSRFCSVVIGHRGGLNQWESFQFHGCKGKCVSEHRRPDLAEE